MEQQFSKEDIKNTLYNLLEKRLYLTEKAHQLIPRGNFRKEALGIITRQHIIHALQAFLQGDETGSDIEDWANEAYGICRDYFTFEAGYGSILDEYLSQLASWGADLRPEQAKAYIQALQSAKYNPNDPTT